MSPVQNRFTGTGEQKFYSGQASFRRGDMDSLHVDALQQQSFHRVQAQDLHNFDLQNHGSEANPLSKTSQSQLNHF